MGDHVDLTRGSGLHNLGAASAPGTQMSQAAARAVLTAGRDMWTTRADATLGVAALMLSDGPSGVRGSARDERRTALCTPCGTALGASWDTALLRRVGDLIAAEARRQSVDVVLGPTINIQRSPLGGRGFESFSEDPLLSGRLAAAWIDGVQGGGVAACPKHFVANDAETSRTTVDCVVDERALREIYLLPFELALARAWTVMAAYNRVNGVPACEHRELLLDTVKGEWNWDGVVVSDWFAAGDTVACARSGLDLEMPGPGRALGPPLAGAVEQGLVPVAEVDDKIARLRLLAERVRGAVPSPGPPDGSALLVDAAVSGTVLLHNDGLLPLVAPGGPWRIALIGPHAVYPSLQGGGSAAVGIADTVPTLAQALRDRYGPGLDLTVELGCADDDTHPPLERLDVIAGPDSDVRGVTVRYLDDDSRVRHREVRRTSTLIWDDGVPGVGRDGGRVEVSAVLRPRLSGRYTFSVRGSGASLIRVDDAVVAALPDQTRPDDPLAPFFGDLWGHGSVALTVGDPVRVTIEMEHRAAGDPLPILCFGCRPPSAPDLLTRATDAARRADATIVVVGTGPQNETESADRTDTALPADQIHLVDAVLAQQPNTAVVMNAGAAVDMPWAARAAAVLYCWFPGQGYADALCAVLSGDREPGGRLPITLAADERHYAAWTTAPDPDGRLHYTESVFVGYRHFDARGHVPAYPFGHGLGYTHFAFLHMSVRGPDEDGTVEVEVEVQNTGGRAGKEVVQLYVAPPPSSVPRPPQELKAFAAVWSEPDGTARVALRLSRRAFAHWDARRSGWRVHPGPYELRVGRSSADIRLTEEIMIGGGAA